jgi:hypothetical protein
MYCLVLPRDARAGRQCLAAACRSDFGSERFFGEYLRKIATISWPAAGTPTFPLTIYGNAAIAPPPRERALLYSEFAFLHY